MDFYVEKKAIQVFERNHVMNEREIHARHEIMLENYVKKIQIESRVIGDLVLNHIVPTAVKYQNVLVSNVEGLKAVGIKGKYTQNTIASIETIAEFVDGILTDVEAMTEARKKANNTEDTRKRAILYNTEVKDYFDKIRYAVDKLELLVDDEDWPLVKYRELLLVK